MHSELKSIQDRKNYLQRKLDKMNKKVRKTKKIKNERTEPWNKNKFLLYNKNKNKMKSTLVDKGLIRPSSKGKSPWQLRGARSGLIHGRQPWSNRKGFQSSLSNFNKYGRKKGKTNLKGSRSSSKKRKLRSFKKSVKIGSDFKASGLRKESPSLVDSVKRREFVCVPPKLLSNEKRNKMIEKEKMSKLFTKERRKQAKNDFMDRAMFNLEKTKIKKAKLKDKFYNYNFKPQINQKRINIYSKKLHKNVYKKSFDKRISSKPKLTGKYFKQDFQNKVDLILRKQR